MSLRARAVLLGAGLAALCTVLTLVAVGSSNGLSVAAVVVIVALWTVTGALSGAAYFQEQSRRGRS